MAKNKRKSVDDNDGVEGPVAKKLAPNAKAVDLAHDPSISTMDASLLSDYFAKSLRHHASDSSSIELEARYLSARAIRDTTDFGNSHNLEQLPAYLEQFTNGGKQALELCTKVASPHTVVITASGIRAAHVTRVLRVYAHDDIKIAKLFAKHMKLKESISFVQKTKINIAVGTPTRIRELIEENAMGLDSLRRIVVDGSYCDEKKRSIFDIREIFLSLADLLANARIQDELESGNVEVLIY